MAESGKLFQVEDIANREDIRIVRATYRAFGLSLDAGLGAGDAADFNFEVSLSSNTSKVLFDTSDGATDADGSTPNHYAIEYASIHGVVYGPASISCIFQAPNTISSTNDVSADAGPPGTFTSAGGLNFTTQGTQAGDVMQVFTSSGNNDGYYRVASATSTVLTLDATDTITTEAATAGLTYAFNPIQVILAAVITEGDGSQGMPFKYEADFRNFGKWGVRFGQEDRLPGRGQVAASGTELGVRLVTEGLGHGNGEASNCWDSFDIVIAARPVYT